MQGFANQRRLAPLLEGGVPVSAKEGGGAGRIDTVRPDAPLRRALRAARDMLDGVGGLGWSIIGFVGGAVFWHFVGFWGFVAEVVLAGGPPVAPVAAVYASAPLTRSASEPVADAGAPACTLVSRDRKTGFTTARPCGHNAPALPADSYEGRQDRIDVAVQDGWIPLNKDGRVSP
ncbi:hypothetical protein [uncultured Hyphomicrobium sp.]|uniref:hypothetical protein n=1 Tax=uncultured Hyphomicrobium sp. TaxID=194373 RepID=UPI0025DCA7DF|nr:hypothetical protein [uncultured Hyphomicrobium sp.]